MITNIHNLPTVFVKAVENDSYSKGDADYSQSEVKNPVRVTHLFNRHKDKIDIDVSDMLYILDGRGMHEIYKMAGMENRLKEERITTTVLNRKISGQIDDYDQDATLYDYKRTS